MGSWVILAGITGAHGAASGRVGNGAAGRAARAAEGVGGKVRHASADGSAGREPMDGDPRPHVQLTWFTSLRFTSSIRKRAEHIPSASSGASQVFRYTMAEGDFAFGVEIAENALRLNGGAIVAGGAAANLIHAGAQCARSCVVDARVPRIAGPRSTPPYIHRVDTDLNGVVGTA